jgi:hypothetical protein
MPVNRSCLASLACERASFRLTSRVSKSSCLIPVQTNEFLGKNDHRRRKFRGHKSPVPRRSTRSSATLPRSHSSGREAVAGRGNDGSRCAWLCNLPET